MKTLIRAAAVGAFLATTAMTAAPAMAQTTADAQFNASTLNLSAQGEVRVAPDMATITLGVQTEAPTAAAAMQQNASQMAAVIAALKRQGIAERDIQTSTINLNAQYQYIENNPPKLTGYRATNNVTIRVNEIARLGGALDAVVNAGANQIQGIGFALKDPKAAEDEARRKAVQALRAKADLYAQALGVRVDRLVNLSESGGYTPQPPMPMMAMARFKEAGDSTPVSGGELSVRVDVSAVYQLSTGR
ncbi:MAG: SIMPL domain-containing protein [Caulobacteraceae bacterium]|nr:MAG: SIMPL domain-containing protein [Caulobacteraceae bacterium]